MKFMKQLRDNITSESIAYGYTLAIWGSGALLLINFNTNPADILSFVTGGVTGFALIAAVAFKGLVKEVEIESEKDFVVTSMVHVFASLGTILVNYVIITSGSHISELQIFFIVGSNTTFLYNIMLLAESYISEDVLMVEERVAGGNT